MMVVENKFNLGQVVFLKTDDCQKPRLVTCVNISVNGLSYDLVNGTEKTMHYEMEISHDKNILINITN